MNTQIELMNDFISKTFKDLMSKNHGQNFCFSPYSLIEALNSAAICMEGENLQQFLDVFGISEYELDIFLQNNKQNEGENYNTLLYSDEYAPILNPLTISELQNLGINNDVFGPDVVSKVNNIVNQKTHGKIKDIISSNDITPLTKFIILNCIYFKKEWENKFEKYDITEIFYAKNNNSIKTDFLTNICTYRYYEDETVDIVELPYKDSNLCCYIFVPQTSFSSFDDIQSIYNNISKVKTGLQVDFRVPEFKIESSFDLSNSVKIAGLDKMFEWNKDWNLVYWNKLKDEAVIKIDKIKQKTYFDFNRKGTEAAAATAIVMTFSGAWGFREPPKYKRIYANRPFMYAVANKNKPENPLFLGFVETVNESSNKLGEYVEKEK